MSLSTLQKDDMSAEPAFWSNVIDSLHTVTPGVYLGGECIDFNLRTHWMRERNHACMWFVHLEAVRAFCTEEGPEEVELQYLRRQVCLPMDEEVPVRPVVFIRFFVDHYFVVVVDYEENLMFTFGRHTNTDLAGVYPHDEEDLEQWQAQWLWLHLQRLFRWEGFSMAPNQVISVNWPQVGAFPLLLLSLR